MTLTSRFPLSFCALILLSIALSGCATIWTKKTQDVSIVIKDTTATIHVVSATGLESTNTGDSATFNMQRGIVQGLSISSPGTKTFHHALIPSGRTPYFYWVQPLNILTLYTGFAIDFMAPRNKIFKDRYAYNLADYRWNTIKDSLDKKIICAGIITSSTISPIYIVKYNADSALLANLKRNSVINKKVAGYLRFKIDESNSSKPFDPYQSPNSEANQNVGLLLEHTTRMNSHYYKSGYIDTVNLFFPDLNNTMFVSCYLSNSKTFVVDYGKKLKALQSEVTGLWMIENAYGEVLDTFTLQAESGTFPYVNLLDYSPTTPQLIDAFENMALKFDKSENLSQVKKHAPINPFTTQISLAKPASIQSKNEALQSIVRIKNNDEFATGFAISEDGMILTTYSNIASRRPDEHPNLLVITDDGKSLAAKVIRVDKAHNLAVLKIDHVFKYAVRLDNKKDGELFSDIVACCGSDEQEVPNTLKLGIISAYRNQNNNELLQLNMNFAPGNQGSPLLNEANEFQGLLVRNFFGELNEGISFAIPGNKIMDYLQLTY